MDISLILAADENNAIGNNNKLLWHLPADLKFFKTHTQGHHVLMGRKTYESIGKALPNRVNLVLSNNKEFNPSDIIKISSIEEGISIAKKSGEDNLFIIGGGSIYEQCLPIASKIYLTQVHTKIEKADTHFVGFNPKNYELIFEEKHQKDDKNAFDYTYLIYKKLLTS